MIIVGIIVLLILDFIWINLTKNMYNKLVQGVQSGKPIKVNIVGAFIAYTLMIIAFVFLIYPIASQNTKHSVLIKSLKYGALFGFVAYGIYNATNYAIFTNYNHITAIIDTLWGTFVFFIATYISLKTSIFLQK